MDSPNRLSRTFSTDSEAEEPVASGATAEASTTSVALSTPSSESEISSTSLTQPLTEEHPDISALSLEPPLSGLPAALTELLADSSVQQSIGIIQKLFSPSFDITTVQEARNISHIITEILIEIIHSFTLAEEFFSQHQDIIKVLKKAVLIHNVDIEVLRKYYVPHHTAKPPSPDPLEDIQRFCNTLYEQELYKKCCEGDFIFKIPYRFMVQQSLYAKNNDILVPNFKRYNVFLQRELQKIFLIQKESDEKNTQDDVIEICHIFLSYMGQIDLETDPLSALTFYLMRFSLALDQIPIAALSALLEKMNATKYVKCFFKNFLCKNDFCLLSIINESWYSHTFEKTNTMLHLWKEQEKSKTTHIEQKIFEVQKRYEKLMAAKKTTETCCFSEDILENVSMYSTAYNKAMRIFFYFFIYVHELESQYPTICKKKLQELDSKFFASLEKERYEEKQEVKKKFLYVQKQNITAKNSMLRAEKHVQKLLEQICDEELEKISDPITKKTLQEKKDTVHKQYQQLIQKKEAVFSALSEYTMVYSNEYSIGWGFFGLLRNIHLELYASRHRIFRCKYETIATQIEEYVAHPVLLEIERKKEEEEKATRKKKKAEKKRSLYPEMPSHTEPATAQAEAVVRKKDPKQEECLRNTHQKKQAALRLLQDLQKITLGEKYAMLDEKIAALSGVQLTLVELRSVVQKCAITIEEDIVSQLTSLSQDINALLKRGFQKDEHLLQVLTSEIAELSEALVVVDLSIESFSKQEQSEKEVSASLKKIKEKKICQSLKMCHEAQTAVNRLLPPLVDLLQRWDTLSNTLLKVVLQKTIDRIEEIITAMENTLNNNHALKKEILEEQKNCHLIYHHLKNTADLVTIECEVLLNNLQTIVRPLTKEDVVSACTEEIELCREKLYQCYVARQECFEKKITLSAYIRLLEQTMDHCLLAKKNFQKEDNTFIIIGNEYNTWVHRKNALLQKVATTQQKSEELTEDSSTLAQHRSTLTAALHSCVKSVLIKKAKKALANRELQQLLVAMNVPVTAKENTGFSTQLTPYLTARHELFTLCMIQRTRLQKREDAIQEAQNVALESLDISFSDVAGLFTAHTRIQQNIAKTLECLRSLSIITQLDQEIEHCHERIERQQHDLRQHLVDTIHKTALTTEKPSQTLTLDKMIELMADIHSAQSVQKVQSLCKKNKVPCSISRDPFSQTAIVRCILHIHNDQGEVRSICHTYCCVDEEALGPISIPEIFLQAECAASSTHLQGPMQSVWIMVNEMPIFTTTVHSDGQCYCVAQHVGQTADKALCVQSIECACFAKDTVARMKGQSREKDVLLFTGTHAKSSFMKLYEQFAYCITLHIEQQYPNGLSFFSFTIEEPGNVPRCIIKTVYDETHALFTKTSLSRLLCEGARKLYGIAQHNMQDSPITRISYSHCIAENAFLHFEASVKEKSMCPLIHHIYPTCTYKVCTISYSDGTTRQLPSPELPH